MEIYQAIILGLFQGFSEFLPISSSGHLLLISHWFGIRDGALFFSLLLHIGTLIPVIIVFRKQIVELFKYPFNKLLLLIYATVPAGIVGLILSLITDLDGVFNDNLWLLSITFLATAFELLWAEKRCKKKLEKEITVKTSLIMGFGQALGVLPGLSRSGTTISAGCLANVKREENATFSFLMSIPIILSAVVLETYKGIKDASILSIDVVPVIFGVVSAMISGYVAIRFMLGVIKKANYKWFSLYLSLISIATLITYFY